MILSRKQVAGAAGFAVILGLTLAWGFLPTVRTLQSLLDRSLVGIPERSHVVLFPLLAAAFCYSLPRPSFPRADYGRALRISIVPVVIAGVYGWLAEVPSLWDAFHSPHQGMMIWAVLGAPLGEEWLFRGWVYRLSQRLWGERWPWATGPLPAPVWISALAFALWHIQNASFVAPPLVAFQVGSTFFAGLWLSYLYRITGNILTPILAHMAINASCYGFFVQTADLLK